MLGNLWEPAEQTIVLSLCSEEFKADGDVINPASEALARKASSAFLIRAGC